MTSTNARGASPLSKKSCRMHPPPNGPNLWLEGAETPESHVKASSILLSRSEGRDSTSLMDSITRYVFPCPLSKWCISFGMRSLSLSCLASYKNGCVTIREARVWEIPNLIVYVDRPSTQVVILLPGPCVASCSLHVATMTASCSGAKGGIFASYTSQCDVRKG